MCTSQGSLRTAGSHKDKRKHETVFLLHLARRKKLTVATTFTWDLYLVDLGENKLVIYRLPAMVISYGGLRKLINISTQDLQIL